MRPNVAEGRDAPRRRRLARWGGLALLTAAAATACTSPTPATPSGAPNPPSSGPPSPSSMPTVPGGVSVPGHAVVAVDAATGAVLAVLDVARDPKLVEVAAGQVWILSLGEGVLSRIDPRLREAGTVEVVGEAVGMAAEVDDLWVAHDDRRLSRLDGATGAVERTLTLAGDPIFAHRNAGFVGVADGTPWLTVPVVEHPLQPHDLWEVDPATGEVLARYEVGRDPLWPAAGGDALWIPVLGEDGLVRLDLGTRRLTAVGDAAFASGVCYGEGSVWVALERTSQVLRLAPADGSVLAPIPLDARARGIAAGGGAIWVTTEAGLTEIDPARNTVRRSIPLVLPVRRGFGPTDLAYLDGIVWVAIE